MIFFYYKFNTTVFEELFSTELFLIFIFLKFKHKKGIYLMFLIILENLYGLIGSCTNLFLVLMHEQCTLKIYINAYKINFTIKKNNKTTGIFKILKYL